jgi:cytoskeleton protein RodZ
VTDVKDEIEVEEAVQDAVEPAPPGRRLREAREAKGLSREEVASQLRLQVRLIEALEEDDETALPPSTFVSGYLRSYARLLEVPEDSVVPANGNKGEPRLVATIATKGEASSRDWPTRLVTYLVVIVIAVSVAMWWVSQRDGNGGDVLETAADGVPEVVEQGGNMSLNLPESSTEEVHVEPGTTDGELPEVPMAELNEGSESLETPETIVEEPVVQEETREVDAPPKIPKPTSGGTQPLSDATPQSRLELHYSADSWTEVTDSAGRQLRYGLVKAGEVLVLRGEAPFRVFLGYASGVNVYYNGELFDHSPFQRRDVARFRIGRAEHNHPGSR